MVQGKSWSTSGLVVAPWWSAWTTSCDVSRISSTSTFTEGLLWCCSSESFSPVAFSEMSLAFLRLYQMTGWRMS
jgi:hypothetical protein